MRGTVALAVAVAGVLLGAGPALAASPSPLFRLTDARIAEASGLAGGIRSPVLYVQNDSGDAARFFAVDRISGATRAVYTVPGARNVDWEDIAVARDAAGTPSVWLADIGDNEAVRKTVQLYRVDEPVVPREDPAPTLRTNRPDVWQLRYPDGAHDAETLVVDDRGRAFVVTKSVLGSSEVFEVPSTPGAQVQTMRQVGAVHFGLTGTPGPFGPIGHLTATGGSFATGLVVIRTYTDAYVWNARDGVAAALRTPPLRVPLPRQQQGEGVCIDGGQLLVDSEGVDSPVYAVPFEAPTPPARSSTDPVAPPMPSTSQPVVITHTHKGTGTVVLVLLVVAGVAFFAIGFVIAGGVLLALRRRRRRR